MTTEVYIIYVDTDTEEPQLEYIRSANAADAAKHLEEFDSLESVMVIEGKRLRPKVVLEEDKENGREEPPEDIQNS